MGTGMHMVLKHTCRLDTHAHKNQGDKIKDETYSWARVREDVIEALSR